MKVLVTWLDLRDYQTTENTLTKSQTNISRKAAVSFNVRHLNFFWARMRAPKHFYFYVRISCFSTLFMPPSMIYTRFLTSFLDVFHLNLYIIGQCTYYLYNIQSFYKLLLFWISNEEVMLYIFLRFFCSHGTHRLPNIELKSIKIIWSIIYI